MPSNNAPGVEMFMINFKIDYQISWLTVHVEEFKRLGSMLCYVVLFMHGYTKFVILLHMTEHFFKCS